MSVIILHEQKYSFFQYSYVFCSTIVFIGLIQPKLHQLFVPPVIKGLRPLLTKDTSPFAMKSIVENAILFPKFIFLKPLDGGYGMLLQFVTKHEFGIWIGKSKEKQESDHFARTLGFFHRFLVEVAFKTNPDGVVVVALGMGTHSVAWATVEDFTFFVDEIMVTDACPSLLLVPLVNILGRMAGFYS